MTEERALAWLALTPRSAHRSPRFNARARARLLVLRYGEGWSWSAIARDLGVTRPRVKQMDDHTLWLLRHPPYLWLLDAVAVLPRNHCLFGTVIGSTDGQEIAAWVEYAVRYARMKQ